MFGIVQIGILLNDQGLTGEKDIKNSLYLILTAKSQD